MVDHIMFIFKCHPIINPGKKRMNGCYAKTSCKKSIRVKVNVIMR